MSESAALEFDPGTPEVDSSLLEDKSVIQCKCVPIDDATEGVRYLKPDKYDLLRGPKCRMHAGIAVGKYRIGAEFIGTFFLVLCAAAEPIVNQKYGGIETLIGKAACAGVAVMVIIFSIGHISGAHLNLPVTIAFVVTRHFPWIQVPGYIAAQVVGLMCASYVLKGVFHPFAHGAVMVPSVNIGQAFALEFLVTFLLMFVIVALATDACAVGDLAGIAVGATVLLDILVAGMSTGASMNPARTLGPAVATGNYKELWMCMVAPPLGAIAGAVTYTAVKLGGYEAEPTRRRKISFRH